MQENCVLRYKPTSDSINLLVSGLQARIIREDGIDSGIWETDELWVKGDDIYRGCFNDEDATARKFTVAGGSRRAMSPPWVRREISSEIQCSCLTYLTFVDLAALVKE